MFPKRQTKRERLAAIMAEIDTSQIRELPEEAEAGPSEGTPARGFPPPASRGHWQSVRPTQKRTLSSVFDCFS